MGKGCYCPKTRVDKTEGLRVLIGVGGGWDEVITFQMEREFGPSGQHI